MENRTTIDWHRMLADIRGERDYWREAYEDLSRTIERIYKAGYHQAWTNCHDRVKEIEAERNRLLRILEHIVNDLHDPGNWIDKVYQALGEYNDTSI